MRSYPHNSPEAAARIVALVLIADGQVCSAELDLLRQLGAERELGLEPHLLPHIVHTLREELQGGGPEANRRHGPLSGILSDSSLAGLMTEISEPALQKTVLRLGVAAARADGRLVEGEARVLDAARRCWRLAAGQELLAPRPSRTHGA